MKYSIILLFLCLFTLSSFAQTKIEPSNGMSDYRKNYEWRIKQATLGGQYIPKDIPDAFKQIKARSDSSSLNTFRDSPEIEAVNYQLARLGMIMTNIWDFYEGSRFSHHLRQVGVTHPEDQSYFMLTLLHRNLNNKPLEIKPLVEKIQKSRYDKKQKERKNEVVIDSFILKKQ
jgi:hypothetical protein